MAMQQKDLTKGSAVQILNEISIEYDFAVPKYKVKSLGIHQELPPFEISVKLAPHFQHFSSLMRVLTSFAIVLEFLIGFRNSSGLLMHKNAIFEMRS